MYIAIDFGTSRTKAQQAYKRNDSTFRKKEAFPMSKRELFLTGMVIILAILLIVQMPNTLTAAADSDAGESEGHAVSGAEAEAAGEASDSYSSPVASPYAEEGLSISNSGSMNLPE